MIGSRPWTRGYEGFSLSYQEAAAGLPGGDAGDALGVHQCSLAGSDASRDRQAEESVT